MKAWHFLPDDGRLRYGDGRAPEDGEWIEVAGDLVHCEDPALPSGEANGLHASRRVVSALGYAPGALCCRVELGGEIIDRGNKICARRRRILWRVDATDTLHEFACRCAEDALALVDDPDPRSVAAIQAKRRWLQGEISDLKLNHARAAAQGAKWAAPLSARAAARSAWATAARSARDAARAAARSARAAARSAWAAAWERQNRRLTAMISARKSQ